MKHNTLHLEGLVKQGVFDGLVQALKLFGIAAITWIDDCLVDGEVKKRTPLYGADLGVLGIRQLEWQCGHSAQTGVINHSPYRRYMLRLLANKIYCYTYFYIRAHVERRTCLHAVEVVIEYGMTQYHTQLHPVA